MIKRSLKIAFGILAASSVMMGFQNCADELDLSSASSASLDNDPKVNLVETSTLNLIEDGEGVLTIEVDNLSDYSISWEKDGQLLDNETTENLIINRVFWFSAGTYVAIATDPEGNEYRSDDIVVTYEALQENKTYNNTAISQNGNTYFVIHQNMATNNAQSFCETARGPNAVRVSHAFFGAASVIRRFAFPSLEENCPVGVNGNEGWFYGFCLRDNGANFNYFIYQNIICGV